MKNRFHNSAFTADRNELLATIQLARTNNIGPITFLKLIAKYNNPSEALKGATATLAAKGKTPFSRDDAERELEQTEKLGACIVTLFDENYPALLSQISDPPVLLTMRGKKNIETRTAAMVGARYASANAISFSHQIAGDLAKKGITVVSGLARGIDTAAHKGALKAGGELPTIAVIAGGIDNIYPPENEDLFAQIAADGVIVTENAPGVTPRAEHFPRRNRIISGLSKVTCVVEAALRSGSLITARFALEQEREVACVPGFPLDPRAEGTNELIKGGAALVTKAEDIAALMHDMNERRIVQMPAMHEDEEEFTHGEIKSDVNLLELIGSSPVSVDDIVSHYGLPPAEVNSLLLEHELTGEIIRHPGNMVSKAA